MDFCWTTIQVSDLDESIKFYTEFMGLGPVARMGNEEHRVVMLGENGKTKLELINEDRPLPAGVGVGVSVGFAPENLDEMISRLADAGIPAIGPISPTPDIRFFFVKDPDGYTVQLVEQKN